jgi:hypothetical protein
MKEMSDEAKLTVLLIAPGKYPETKTISNTLKCLQEQVGGLIQVVYPWGSINACLICNDEGKLMELPMNRAIHEIDDIIAGNFLICGLCEAEDGGYFCSLTPEQIKEFEKKYHSPEFFMRSPMGIIVKQCTPEYFENTIKRGSTKSKKHIHRER